MRQPLRLRRGDGSRDCVDHYDRIFGVSAIDLRQSPKLVEGDIGDGEVLGLYGGELHPSAMEEEIRRHWTGTATPAVWYRSGHFFYSGDLLDDSTGAER
jgi:hypothetical protein